MSERPAAKGARLSRLDYADQCPEEHPQHPVVFCGLQHGHAGEHVSRSGFVKWPRASGSGRP